MDLITFNSDYLIKNFSELITLSLDRLVLRKDDIKIFSISTEDFIPPVAFDEAIAFGAKPLDALLYFMLPVNNRPEVLPNVQPIRESVNFVKVEKLRLTCYLLYVLIRGGVPNINNNMPEILNVIFESAFTTENLLSNVASFKLSKMKFNWFKDLKFSEMPDLIKNRLMLGLPGHRYINVIRFFRADTLDTNLLRLQTMFCNYVGKDYYWDIFPLTRTAAFSAYFISFNKVMMTFISQLYGQEKLNTFLGNKIIPVMPIYDERFTAYLGWDESQFPRLLYKINF